MAKRPFCLILITPNLFSPDKVGRNTDRCLGHFALCTEAAGRYTEISNFAGKPAIVY